MGLLVRSMTFVCRGKDKGGFDSEAESVVSLRSSRRSGRRSDSDGEFASKAPCHYSFSTQSL